MLSSFRFLLKWAFEAQREPMTFVSIGIRTRLAAGPDSLNSLFLGMSGEENLDFHLMLILQALFGIFGKLPNIPLHPTYIPFYSTSYTFANRMPHFMVDNLMKN